jgi:small subunit ribosomal protein S17
MGTILWCSARCQSGGVLATGDPLEEVRVFWTQKRHSARLTMTAEQGKTTARRELTGKVVSTKMDKTVSVEVTRRVKHRRYKKYLNRSNVFKAHDENNDCQLGETVTIQESRPLSATKRWVVIGRQEQP